MVRFSFADSSFSALKSAFFAETPQTYKIRAPAALEIKSPFSIHIISEVDGTLLIARSESMNWTQPATNPKLLALVRGLRLGCRNEKSGLPAESELLLI
jgi:hypothetical protein